MILAGIAVAIYARVDDWKRGDDRVPACLDLCYPRGSCHAEVGRTRPRQRPFLLSIRRTGERASRMQLLLGREGRIVFAADHKGNTARIAITCQDRNLR